MSDNKEALSINLLVEELSGVTEWYTLGIFLGLTENEIKAIEQDHDGTARRRMAVLNKWLKKETDLSWLIIISALEKMSEMSLANQLRKKYEKPAMTCDAESTDNLSVSKPVVLKINRKEILVRELEDIEKKYLRLIVETESAMETCNPSQMQLKRFSKFYTSVRVTTVNELFDHLEQYCFLDYTLLEMVISFFLKDQAAFVVSEFHAYIRHLEEFKSSTTIRQFMESIETAQKQLTTTTGGVETCTVCLRLVGGWLEKTMADLDELLKELFQDKRSVLSHIQIVRGSIIVTYSAPQLKAESLISIAKQVKLSLSQVGVCGLLIADTVVKVNMQSDPLISFERSLYKAIFNADINLLKVLLRINTDPNKIEDSISSLFVAIITKVDLHQIHSIVDLLLKAGADPNLQLKDGLTPLYVASQLGYTDIVRLLIQANANPNLRFLSDGSSALHIASRRGYSDVVRILLDAKANPNIQADNGSTPLFMASQCGYANIVGLLLAAKANPDFFFKGKVALHVASLIGHSNVVDSLLKANANPDSQGMDGFTPLILACEKGHFDVVDLLLKANGNPNLSTHKGVTPLMMASRHGHSDIVRILLDANADPNLQHPASGLTALMYASFSGCLESVELLLMSGADASVLSLRGLSALHLAASKGHEDIVHLIQAVELSQSSSNSPVLTTNEIASNVSNESLSILKESLETMLVAESEALISTHFKNFDKTLLPKHKLHSP